MKLPAELTGSWGEMTTCLLCRRPIERHQGDDLELEIRGRARMAAARKHCGLSLSKIEAWCLNWAGGHPASPTNPTGSNHGQT